MHFDFPIIEFYKCILYYTYFIQSHELYINVRVRIQYIVCAHSTLEFKTTISMSKNLIHKLHFVKRK